MNARTCEGCGKMFRVSDEAIEQYREDERMLGAEPTNADVLAAFPLCLVCEFGDHADPAEVAAETVNA